MNSKNTLIKILSVMIVFSVLITACGGAAATQAPATQAPATQAPAATEAPAGKIYDGVTIDILAYVGPRSPNRSSAVDLISQPSQVQRSISSRCPTASYTKRF